MRSIKCKKCNIRAKRFFSLEEIRSCTNGRVSLLLDKLADGYAARHKQGARSRIYALAGMALAMLGEARAGNEVLFEQFDASVHLLHRGGAYVMPPNPPLLVTLGGEPFWLSDDAESMWMENALWDSFLILADNLGDGMPPVSQFFYDFADRRQCLAYRTQQLYREEHQEWMGRLSQDPITTEITKEITKGISKGVTTEITKRITTEIAKLISSKNLEIMVQVTNNFYGAVTVNGTMSGDVHNPVFYGSSVQKAASAVNTASAEASSVSDNPVTSLLSDNPVTSSVSRKSQSSSSSSSSSSSVDVFSSEAARRVMGRLVGIGVLDEDLQPLHLSWSERGVLAQQVSLKLGIENQWVTFGELWNMKASALRSACNNGLNLAKIGKFLDRILPAIG